MNIEQNPTLPETAEATQSLLAGKLIDCGHPEISVRLSVTTMPESEKAEWASRNQVIPDGRAYIAAVKDSITCGIYTPHDLEEFVAFFRDV